jgi:hypothetical protein
LKGIFDIDFLRVDPKGALKAFSTDFCMSPSTGVPLLNGAQPAACLYVGFHIIKLLLEDPKGANIAIDDFCAKFGS